MVSEPVTEWCASKDAGPQGGRLGDPTLVGEGNEAFLIRVWRPLTERENPKMTISASGGFGLLQIVSEPVIEWCASEDAGPPRGWIERSHMKHEAFLIRVWKPLLSRCVI